MSTQESDSGCLADVSVKLETKTKTNDREGASNISLQDKPEFQYTQADHFTSELYKIEIGNVPKISRSSYILGNTGKTLHIPKISVNESYLNIAEYKKLLKKKLDLKPHKIKVIPRVGKIYVTFKNEEEKKKAFEALDNFEYKGNLLKVKNAKPKVDAMAGKRSLDDRDNQNNAKRRKTEDIDLSTSQLSPAELLRRSVTKWHDISYEDQLTKAYDSMKEFLQTCRYKLGQLKLAHEVFVWIMKNKDEVDGMCCPLKSIIPSPVTTKYRNKSEFTAGISTDGLQTVGYRVGKYRDQTCAVEETSGIDILPDNIQRVAKEFQDYVRSSNKAIYNPQNHQGHWRQLTVRSTLDGEVMAVVIVTENKDFDEAQQTEEKDSLKKFFEEKEREGLVSTLLYQIIPTHRKSGQIIEPPKVIFGDGHITEKLLGLKFRISPDAFFQCNTRAAEVLYSEIGKMLNLDDRIETAAIANGDKEGGQRVGENNEVILFDVCCGTGTIGLTLASKVKRVVGIEMNEQAVKDAKRNAELNGVENVEFHCGKAEHIMPGLVKAYSKGAAEIVAVVDPPRAGLHDKVIQCMRACSSIKTVIYVSCNPQSIYKNFSDLCQRPSKRMSGLPFLPYCAQPVDLYPHTTHCELIIHFKRITGDGGGQVKSNSADNEKIHLEKSKETASNDKPPGSVSDTKETRNDAEDSQGPSNGGQETNASTEMLEAEIESEAAQDTQPFETGTGKVKIDTKASTEMVEAEIEAEAAQDTQPFETGPDMAEIKTSTTVITIKEELGDSEGRIADSEITEKVVTENVVDKSSEATAKETKSADRNIVGTCTSSSQRVSDKTSLDKVEDMEVDHKTAPVSITDSNGDKDSGCSEGHLTDSECVDEIAMEKAFDTKPGRAKGTETTPRKGSDNESGLTCVSPKRLRASVKNILKTVEETPEPNASKAELPKTSEIDEHGASTRRTTRSLRSATKRAVDVVTDKDDNSNRESDESSLRRSARKPRRISYTEAEVHAKPDTGVQSQPGRRSLRLRTPRKLIQIQADIKSRAASRK